MYCPKCNKFMQSNFCEVCGTKTVDNSDGNSNNSGHIQPEDYHLNSSQYQSLPKNTPMDSEIFMGNAKISVVSILALIFSFIPFLCFAGFIMGIIDTATGNSRRKNKTLSVIAIIIGAIVSVIMLIVLCTIFWSMSMLRY